MSFTAESVIYPADVVDESDQNDRAQVVGMIAYLQTRFYPPLPADYALPALAALRLCRDDDADARVALPHNINPLPRTAGKLSDGTPTVRAGDLIDNLRLWDHVDSDQDAWT